MFVESRDFYEDVNSNVELGVSSIISDLVGILSVSVPRLI